MGWMVLRFSRFHARPRTAEALPQAAPSPLPLRRTGRLRRADQRPLLLLLLLANRWRE